MTEDDVKEMYFLQCRAVWKLLKDSVKGKIYIHIDPDESMYVKIYQFDHYFDCSIPDYVRRCIVGTMDATEAARCVIGRYNAYIRSLYFN